MFIMHLLFMMYIMYIVESHYLATQEFVLNP